MKKCRCREEEEEVGREASRRCEIRLRRPRREGSVSR